MLLKITEWVQKDGTSVPLRRLSDAHLLNALLVMERSARILVDVFYSMCIVEVRMLEELKAPQSVIALAEEKKKWAFRTSDNIQLFGNACYMALLKEAERRRIAVCLPHQANRKGWAKGTVREAVKLLKESKQPIPPEIVEP